MNDTTKPAGGEGLRMPVAPGQACSSLLYTIVHPIISIASVTRFPFSNIITSIKVFLPPAMSAGPLLLVLALRLPLLLLLLTLQLQLVLLHMQVVHPCSAVLELCLWCGKRDVCGSCYC